MQINWNYIKMVALFGVVVFLFAFASNRNAGRKISMPNVKFVGKSRLFVTHETVSKLLIQNQKDFKNMPKETLDLNKIENELKSNLLIKSAEVYLSVNGRLSVDVEQKTPIARISNDVSYYLDDEGLYMPLSKNFSARVPFITGNVKREDLKTVYTVAQKVTTDPFLKKNVYEIHQNNDKSISLRLRKCDFLVQLGTVKFLDKKINNLKAFYKKNLKENVLQNYIKVNLEFENQVIGTKI